MDSSLHHDPFAPDDLVAGEPYPGYNEENAKDIITIVGEASLDDARRVLAYESAQKDPRKTVVEAAQKRVDTLEEEELARTPVRHSENPETVAAVRESLGLPEPTNDQED